MTGTADVFRPHGLQPAWKTEYTTLEAIAEDDETLTFRLSSDFDPEYAGFILDQAITAVEAMVATPQTAISSLSTLGDAERTLLVSLSPRIEGASGDFLHSRFERWVAARPHHIAIQWQSSEYVSYIQLNNRANRLATILRAKGVGPNVFVPICLEK
jgi:non-ribosomal peptide synthetase component F